MTAQAGYSQLTQLYPTGPGAPLESALPKRWTSYGLFVSIRHVTDTTLTAVLPALASRPVKLHLIGEQRQHVQSLLKVAIHGGGGATRPDLGRAVQFEGHWIARLNPGRQRAGGAAGAGAE